MSGWDARMWAGVIITGFTVLAGLALLLWPPGAGTSWWSWRRLCGAGIVAVALVIPASPGPTRGGLIWNGVVWIAMALWFLLKDLWSVDGPDLPAGTILRQRSALAAGLSLYGGAIIALGLTIPR